MAIYSLFVQLVCRINDVALNAARRLAILAMALMVVAILLQIFFRYVLNNALPWPEEAARALMIWMMALIAPTAYRNQGFVAIEMLADMLPKRASSVLNFLILALSTLVIIVMLSHAWAHFSAPLLFDSSGLNMLLQSTGINQLFGTNLKFTTSYIYFAMTILLVLMLAVSFELFLKKFQKLFWPNLTIEDGTDSPISEGS